MAETLSTRRECLQQGLIAAGSLVAASHVLAEPATQPAPGSPTAERQRFKKGVLWSMLPESLSIEDRFRLARDVGFDGVEIQIMDNPDQVQAIRRGIDATGVPVHSIMNSSLWRDRLTDDDPAVVAKGMEAARLGLANAKALGATTMLTIPGVVNATTSYKEAYARATEAIGQLVPQAKEAGVILAIEEVWNKFLLSPLEMVQFIDQFGSPYVRAYFDCGNVVAYGYPEDWIRTLGKRIVKVHLKDFDRKRHEFVPLLEGDIDWKTVREALLEVGYEGYMTAELPGGDRAYLEDVSARMSRIIAGQT